MYIVLNEFGGPFTNKLSILSTKSNGEDMIGFSVRKHEHASEHREGQIFFNREELAKIVTFLIERGNLTPSIEEVPVTTYQEKWVVR